MTMTTAPLLTLVVLAYRQAPLIDAAIASALAQTGEPIEILLSDDASPDDTFARMQAHAAAYHGPHQVIARRNPVNLGLGAHVNTVMQAARGELILLMAGDDLCLPERAQRVREAWDATGRRVDLIASHVIDMAPDGTDLGLLRVDDLAQWRSVADWARRRPHVIGAAHAVTRRLFDRFGPMADDCLLEDQVNTLRTLCAGGACTVDAPLLRYRRGGVSGRHVDADGAALRTRLKRVADRHLALHRQWQRDATLAGCLDTVRAATDREEQREQFLAALLADPARRPPLPLLWDGRFRVRTGWRLSKWLRVAFAGLTVRIDALKARLRA
ncbi:glycosyltransferase family A protein [Sphaerotilus sp.]|uniref:glycosyltransferase family 2 protein n=1 Tax=Sphaerotilus sp. TaxID=2093942 RepID=UPI00286E3E9D|nr:glycosyltransferase family A protein [Sphaerotilus sp.]